MYFHSRTEAGEKLAEQLMAYRYENCAVAALSYDSLLVAEVVAAKLHSMLGLFLSEKVDLPGENLTVGTVNQGGGFLYNRDLSEGERDDYYSEFHGYIDEQKREKSDYINHLLTDGGAISAEMLREHVVVLVSDGLKDPAALDAAVEFMKPIKIKRLIVATPIASVAAVDRMHILADELHCLSVTENYLDTDHYYDENVRVTHDQALKKISNIVLQWR
jgi:putative phosphoribosyl transferase